MIRRYIKCPLLLLLLLLTEKSPVPYMGSDPVSKNVLVSWKHVYMHAHTQLLLLLLPLLLHQRLHHSTFKTTVARFLPVRYGWGFTLSVDNNFNHKRSS